MCEKIQTFFRTPSFLAPPLSPIPRRRSLLASPSPRGQTSDGGAVSREDLGRSTWLLLHTLAAQFPDDPTRQQQKDVRNLIDALTRVYPCGECARHFGDIVARYPPDTSSGMALQQWTCGVHNVVNDSLGKPRFNCAVVDARWVGGLHTETLFAHTLST